MKVCHCALPALGRDCTGCPNYNSENDGLIDLLKKWMEENSDYDEKTWEQLKNKGE